MKDVKFGICQWSFPLDGPYACRIASQLGLEGIELDLGDYERNFPLSSKVIQQAYREAGEEWGISYPSIAVNALCNYGMTNPLSTKKGEIARLALKKGVEAAQALQIPIVQLPSFFDGEIKNEEDFKEFVNCMKFICSYAMDRGVIIGTENVLAAEDVKRLIEEVGFPNLKVFFDLQNHYYFKGYKISEVLRELAPYICEVHAKDGKTGDLSGALLGQGDVDFFKSVKILKEIGYKGWIHLENYYDREPLNQGDREPFELLGEDIKILKGAFK